jgi:hypothetical protein
MGMRLSKFAAVGAALILIACSDGTDRGESDVADTTSAGSTVPSGDPCAVATPEVLSAWFGWNVEPVATEAVDGCSFSRLPYGQLTIASTPSGVTVTAAEGFSDEQLAHYLSTALGATDDDIDARIAAVEDLDADGHAARCGLLLSVGDSETTIWAQPSSVEFGENWPANGLARLEFGSGLDEDACASPVGTTTRSVDASWPVSFDRLEFSITPTNGACGDASLVLHGAVALAPDGRTIELPDPLTTRNTDFGVFGPDDCQLR